MKLTPWFDGDQKPVRVGTYQRNFCSAILWSYWDGKYWSIASRYMKTTEAYSQNKYYSEAQDLPWRGVMK